MLKSTILATAVVMFSGANSFAAEDNNNSIDDVFGWGGFYGGVHFGLARGDANTKGISGEPYHEPLGLGHVVSTGPEGVMYGGQIGFNWQFDNGIILGVEIEGGDLSAQDENIGTREVFAGVEDTGIVVEYGAYGVLAGRVGYAVDRWMFNAKAGYAIAQVDVIAGDVDPPFTGTKSSFDPIHSFSEGRRVNGYAVGGGFEYAVDNNWTLKAEYLYMDFGSFRSFDPHGDGYRTDLDLHTVKVGVNYKF